MDPLHFKSRKPKAKRRKKPLSQEIKSTYKTLSGIVLAFGIILSVLILYANSHNSTQGYHLQQLQSEHQRLLRETEKINHKIMEAKSLLEIQDKEILDSMSESSSDQTYFIENENNYALNPGPNVE